MATARFKAEKVYEFARKKKNLEEATYTSAREDELRRLQDTPIKKGIWPFRRTHWRTVSEAEHALYMSCYAHAHKRRAEKAEDMMRFAGAALGPNVQSNGPYSDGHIELSPLEADFIGLVEAGRK